MATTPHPTQPPPSYTSTLHTGESDYIWQDEKPNHNPYNSSTNRNNPWRSTPLQVPQHTSSSSSSSTNHAQAEESFPILPEPFDQIHPHYAAAAPSPLPSYPPSRLRRRLPPKRLLIPWILAAVLFLTTLGLGIRLLSTHCASPIISDVDNDNDNTGTGTSPDRVRASTITSVVTATNPPSSSRGTRTTTILSTVLVTPVEPSLRVVYSTTTIDASELPLEPTAQPRPAPDGGPKKLPPSAENRASVKV